MAKRSDASSSRATTAPKGRPTRSRHDIERRSGLLSSNAQWLVLTLVVLAGLIALLAALS